MAKTLGRDEFTSAYSLQPLRAVGRNARQCPGGRNFGGGYLLARCLAHSQTYAHNQAHLPRDGTAHHGLSSSTLITSQSEFSPIQP